MWQICISIRPLWTGSCNLREILKAERGLVGDAIKVAAALEILIYLFDNLHEVYPPDIQVVKFKSPLGSSFPL